MKNIKIENNIPLWRKRPGQYRHVLGSMEIGQSFLAPKEANIAAIAAEARVQGIKISRRKDPQTGQYRVWRVG